MYKANKVALKYITPFLKLIKTELLKLTLGLRGTSRPSEAVAGDEWTNTDTGIKYYFDGTDDIPIFEERPTDLSDGDKWIPLKGNPFGIYTVSGALDLLESGDNGNITVYNTGSVEDVTEVKGGKVILYSRKGTSDETRTEIVQLPDGTGATWTVYDSSGSPVSIVKSGTDGSFTHNGNDVITDKYDTASMIFESRDRTLNDQYLSLRSELGGQAYGSYLKVVFMRVGNMVTAAIDLEVSDVSWSTEDERMIASAVKLMTLAREEGFFNASVVTETEFTGSYGSFTDSFDTINPVQAMHGSISDGTTGYATFRENGTGFKGLNETHTYREYHFNVTFAVKDV